MIIVTVRGLSLESGDARSTIFQKAAQLISPEVQVRTFFLITNKYINSFDLFSFPIKQKLTYKDIEEDTSKYEYGSDVQYCRSEC